MEHDRHYLRDLALRVKLVFPFRVVILLDVSETNSMYIIHIQHALRLLLEEQLANKDALNVIAYVLGCRGRWEGPWGPGRQEVALHALSDLGWPRVYLILNELVWGLNNSMVAGQAHWGGGDKGPPNTPLDQPDKVTQLSALFGFQLPNRAGGKRIAPRQGPCSDPQPSKPKERFQTLSIAGYREGAGH